MKSIFFATLTLLATTVLSVSVTSDSADGIYHHVNNPLTGRKISYKIADLNENFRRQQSPTKRSRKLFARQDLPADSSLKCGGDHSVSEDEYLHAQDNLYNAFTQLDTWHYQLSCQYGEAVVYACDYSKGGQQTAGSMFNATMAKVQTCGNSTEGWYDITKSWGASYGRTKLNNQYCH